MTTFFLEVMKQSCEKTVSFIMFKVCIFCMAKIPMIERYRFASRSGRLFGMALDAKSEFTIRDNAHAIVQKLMTRARKAMDVYGHYAQEQVDEVVQAAAWAIYKQGHAEALARLSVQDTGLGKYEDKVLKNRRKTLGTLRDLLGAKSVGIIHVDKEKGITEIAKPVGVVAAVVPSTNPAATPANITMMALKGRNAIIIAPSPKGARTTQLYLDYVHEELKKVGAPVDLVQSLPLPVNKALTTELI